MHEGSDEAHSRAGHDESTVGQRSEDAAEIAKTVHRLYLGLLGFGVYLIVTLSVEDAVLVRADAEIEIPMFGVGVDLSRILLFAPICLVALTFYLHLFYGQLLAFQRGGVRLSQAYLFTMPGLPARIASNLILYATLPLVLAWSTWKALFRAEAPVLLGLTIASAVVLAWLYDHRGRQVCQRAATVAWFAVGIIAALAPTLALYSGSKVWVWLVASRQVDLVGANLSRADLQGINLQNLDLTRARLDGADLFNADLRGANLTGAVLTDAKLIGANLTGAVLAGANLHGARFEQLPENGQPGSGDESIEAISGDMAVDVDNLPSCLPESSANLSRVNLRGARLTRTILRNANLQDADLTEAILRQADLSCANVARAEMSGANLIRVTAQRLRAANVKLDRAKLGRADLRGANFVQASLRSADLDQAIVGDTSLAWADLTDASLRELVLRGPVNLIGATFTGTTPDADEICADEKLVQCTGVVRSTASTARPAAKQ